MPALPPNLSIPAAQVGAQARPAGKTPNQADAAVDFAQVLCAQLNVDGAPAVAIDRLAADQPKAAEATLKPDASQQEDRPHEESAPVAPDATAAVLALAGAQAPLPAAVDVAGTAPTPSQAEGRTVSPGKPTVQPQVLEFARAAAHAAEEPASSTDTDPQPLALATPESIAGARQALPEAHMTTAANPDSDELLAQSSAQPTAAVSAPVDASPREVRATTSGPRTVEVQGRLGTPAFADDFGNRVVWMAGHGQQAAEFRIDPPHLGPVEVRLALSNDQANLVLLSPHASVREALQSTLPRLQELLGAAGINLGSVHVGTQGSGQGRQTADPSTLRSERLSPGGIEAQSTFAPAAGWMVRGTGVVDTYA